MKNTENTINCKTNSPPAIATNNAINPPAANQIEVSVTVINSTVKNTTTTIITGMIKIGQRS